MAGLNSQFSLVSIIAAIQTNEIHWLKTFNHEINLIQTEIAEMAEMNCELNSEEIKTFI